MKAIRHLGLGGALILLSAICAARADSNDLAENQRLLDARIDQLANIGQNPGVGPIYSVDQNPLAGSALLAGSFPHAILIPGTETSLKLSGWISMHSDYWLHGGPPNSSPTTANTGATGQLQAIPLRNTVAAAGSERRDSSDNSSMALVNSRTRATARLKRNLSRSSVTAAIVR